MNNSKELKKSQVINPEDILKFVGECASKLLLLKGIVTPPEAIKAIAKELPKLIPSILENKKAILLTIALSDFTFRSPKQMTVDDFFVTSEKINAFKNFGMKVYTEEEVSRIKKNITNSKIIELENENDNLKEQIRILEFKWKNFPEESTRKGYAPFMNMLYELMDKYDSVSNENDKLKMIIKRLEKRNYYTNNANNSLKNVIENSEPESVKTEIETVVV